MAAGRRERRKQRDEARILRAAARLFEVQGYDATGMKEIARRARVAVGTLYNHFDSKPQLALALLRRDAAEGLEATEAVLKQPPDDPVEAVVRLLERELEPFTRHDRRLWRELTAAALRDRRIGQGLLATDLQLVARLVALLRELASRGDLRPDTDVGRAGVALYAVFFTWFLTFVAADDLEPETLRREVRRGIELVMRGLLADAGGLRGETP